MNTEQKHYLILSPEISCIIPIMDYGEGPTEYYKCVTYIHANNKNDAKVLAIKTKDMYDWVQWCRHDNTNPLTGLDVQECHCDHGKCWCDSCVDEHGECEDCMREAEEHYKKESNI